jgi:hypothetical protein
MLIFSCILILVGSMGIIYEDWTEFQIQIKWYFILFLGIIVYILWYFNPIGYQFYWPGLGLNTLIVVTIFSLISLMVSIRNKALINIFKNHFGLGDLLSLVLFCFWFPTQSFLLILISSSVLGIIVEQVRKVNKIPLATYLSMFSLPIHFIQISPYL